MWQLEFPPGHVPPSERHIEIFVSSATSFGPDQPRYAPNVCPSSCTRCLSTSKRFFRFSRKTWRTAEAPDCGACKTAFTLDLVWQRARMPRLAARHSGKITNSIRRFVLRPSTSGGCERGRSSPNPRATNRSASIPFPTRKTLTASARFCASSMLYWRDPRLSVWAPIWIWSERSSCSTLATACRIDSLST